MGISCLVGKCEKVKQNFVQLFCCYLIINTVECNCLAGEKGGQVRDELKAANGYEGEDGAFKLNIENNLKKQQQMVVME